MSNYVINGYVQAAVNFNEIELKAENNNQVGGTYIPPGQPKTAQSLQWAILLDPNNPAKARFKSADSNLDSRCLYKTSDSKAGLTACTNAYDFTIDPPGPITDQTEYTISLGSVFMTMLDQVGNADNVVAFQSQAASDPVKKQQTWKFKQSRTVGDKPIIGS